ncbi:uncharacterized protein LOC111328544 isoform X2 [Stylophora pistillata]|uniref:Uncharacterized protein n=1 Tax=Stylophora pistillata TaxID=50429 RepID=A0A2B4SCC9_STYPI|nr:uncharacterized protein LOC111328544 isoform X2 [Stylophora pistillata]PFX26749.1 hypothetical protein AWC38_SpisGene8543 [Stylophora pistillata]
MPTAGEATLKSQSLKKTAKDAASSKGNKKAIKPRSANTGEAKKGTKTTSKRTSGKSSIPVPVKRGLRGKENADPNVDPVKPIKKSTKVKKAPDFRKLHQKWENQFSKGKAVAKRKNTRFEPFDLAIGSQQGHRSEKPFIYNSGDEQDPDAKDEDEDFKIDSTALKEILSNTGIKDKDRPITGRATIAGIPSSKSGLTTHVAEGTATRTSIYYTGPPTQHALEASSSALCTPRAALTGASSLKQRQVDNALTRSQASSCVKKQVAWADEENEEFEFQPDSQALQSILSNTGITFNQSSAQPTSRVTLAGGRVTSYRRTRQSFREPEPQRTSIYYTGPRLTRPIPKARGMGRTSVFGTRNMTAGSALSSQKLTMYDPLATIVGRQGHQELENKPIVSSGAMKVASSSDEPNPQTVNGNLLFTPAREQVSSAKFVSTRNQPSWAEIFTPQRGISTQDSAVRAVRSQAFHEPLRTPVNQPDLQGDICTPQRITGVRNASLAQLPSRQQQSETVATPVKHVAIHSESFSPDHPPIWSEMFTPQNATRHPEAMMTSPTNNPPSTPMWQNFSTTQRSGSTQDLGSRLRCSTVEITSFKPDVDTSCYSMEDPQEPKQMADVQDGRLKLTTQQEEDGITRLERQALEDLGLLKVTEESPKDTPGPPGNIRENNNLMRSPIFDNWINESNTKNPRTPANSQTSPRSVTISRSAGIASELFRSSCKSTPQTSSSSHYSRFSPVVRLATPTPVGQSSTNSHSALYNWSQQGVRATSAIQFNSTPLYCHQDVPANNAPRVDDNHKCDGFLRNPVNLQYSAVNQTQCVTPTPVKATNRAVLQTTLGDVASPVQTASQQTCRTVASRTSPTDKRAMTSQRNLSKEPYNRPVQVVSPTSKTQRSTYTPSDNRSLSLRSALAFNTRKLGRPTIEDSSTLNAGASTRFRWKPNLSEVVPTAFRPTVSGSRRIPKTLAQEALLDLEVSVYMTAGNNRLVTSTWSERPLNPLAKVFLEGDSRHFLPINDNHSR